jgi:pyruvate/2-oxoglutarate dehydrogenase complex dihydrolipoamide dehydrogenase (E3) component
VQCLRGTTELTQQAIIAGNSIVAKHDGTYDSQVGGSFTRLSRKPAIDALPQVVFSDPQVAWVGLSAEQAQRNGLRVCEVSTKMQGPGTFLHAENYDGWAQWVVEDGGRIVGATFVGREVADLLHPSTVAVVNGLTWLQMFHAVPSFPTVSEVYHNLVEACAASEK